MGTNTVVFGLNAGWVAIVIFTLSYALIITERINRSIVALLGAGMMIVSGLLTQEEAIRGVDFNTIALLTGMMVLVSISRRGGMFEYLAVSSSTQARPTPHSIPAM